MKGFIALVALASFIPSSLAFSPSPTTTTAITKTTRYRPAPLLFASNKEETPQSNKKKGGGLDESVRTKLVSESIAPWRSLRLFLYGAMGSGALIGGLVTLSGAAAVLSGAKEGDINTEVRTCACCVAVVAPFTTRERFCCVWQVFLTFVFQTRTGSVSRH